MAKTKWTDEELEIKERIENYNIDEKNLLELKEKLEYLKELDSGSISQYGKERVSGGVGGCIVSNIVERIISLEEKIKALEYKLSSLIQAKETLSDEKKEVIDSLIFGYKMSQIARNMGVTRKKVVVLRGKAIREMNIFLNVKIQNEKNV